MGEQSQQNASCIWATSSFWEAVRGEIDAVLVGDRRETEELRSFEAAGALAYRLRDRFEAELWESVRRRWLGA